MTHHPYPNVDHALAQIDRHARPVDLPEWRVKLAADARRALAAGGDAMEQMLRALQNTQVERSLPARRAAA